MREESPQVDLCLQDVRVWDGYAWHMLDRQRWDMPMIAVDPLTVAIIDTSIWDDTDAEGWLSERCPTALNDYTYVRFADDRDAVLFLLRWSGYSSACLA